MQMLYGSVVYVCYTSLYPIHLWKGIWLTLCLTTVSNAMINVGVAISLLYTNSVSLGHIHFLQDKVPDPKPATASMICRPSLDLFPLKFP